MARSSKLQSLTGLLLAANSKSAFKYRMTELNITCQIVRLPYCMFQLFFYHSTFLLGALVCRGLSKAMSHKVKVRYSLISVPQTTMMTSAKLARLLS